MLLFTFSFPLFYLDQEFSPRYCLLDKVWQYHGQITNIVIISVNHCVLNQKFLNIFQKYSLYADSYISYLSSLAIEIYEKQFELLYMYVLPKIPKILCNGQHWLVTYTRIIARKYFQLNRYNICLDNIQPLFFKPNLNKIIQNK